MGKNGIKYDNRRNNSASEWTGDSGTKRRHNQNSGGNNVLQEQAT
jgi:hypothetical protein